MPLEIHCRRCGKPFTPDYRAIASGNYRLCPACRGGGPPAVPVERHTTNPGKPARLSEELAA